MNRRLSGSFLKVSVGKPFLDSSVQGNQESGFYRLAGGPDRAEHSPGVRTPVTDKDQSINPQQRSSPDLSRIHRLLDFAKGWFRQQGSELGAQAAGQRRCR